MFITQKDKQHSYLMIERENMLFIRNLLDIL
jgi:hypothetical protein